MSKPSRRSCRLSENYRDDQNNDFCDDDDDADDADDADDHLVSIEEHAATKESGEASGKEKADRDYHQFHEVGV